MTRITSTCPSFGEWGFVLAGPSGPTSRPPQLPAGLRFLDRHQRCRQMFDFPRDMQRRRRRANRLNDQVLVRYYEQEWSEISH